MSIKWDAIPCSPEELPIEAHSCEVGLMWDDFMYMRQTIAAKNKEGRTIALFSRQWDVSTNSYGPIEPRQNNQNYYMSKETDDIKRRIGAFMGGYVSRSGRTIMMPPNKSVRSIFELRYDSRWDWIMPVVRKIESLTYRDGRGDVNFVVCIDSGYTNISVGGESLIAEESYDNDDPNIDEKLLSVFRVIDKFIIWYTK